MSTFTIDVENNITALTGLPTSGDELQSFSTSQELAKLTTDWPLLGGHLKTGHLWTPENRPTEWNQDKVFIP